MIPPRVWPLSLVGAITDFNERKVEIEKADVF